ncbi:hypothetical protein SLA2020_417550 [Shorea laevis]
MVTVSSKPCLVAPVSTPEVVLVPVSTGFRPKAQSAGQESSPVRPEDAGDQVRQAGSSPMRSEEAGDRFLRWLFIPVGGARVFSGEARGCR